ncbi:hypothetical protein N8D56_11170 [Devosia sp. A8/3-2]|nr:hypothetical protein N8D56_11170 [Devosia sp. A8/3-2]
MPKTLRPPTPTSRRRERAQYVGGMPDDIAARMNPKDWEEDWRVMSLPGGLELQRALVRDYQHHVARF